MVNDISMKENFMIIESWDRKGGMEVREAIAARVGIFRVFFNTMSETKPKCCQP
jgi:hypothetical protein